SYGLSQVPCVILQVAVTVTPCPSRLSTSSRVLQPPPRSIQCGNRARLYPDIDCAVATVSTASSSRAAEGATDEDDDGDAVTRPVQPPRARSRARRRPAVRTPTA